MRSALLDFERTTRDLRLLIDRNRLEENLLSISLVNTQPVELQKLLEKYRSRMEPYSLRQAQYSTQLVLLYGAVERLMEGLLTGLADGMADLVPTFDLLPAQIRDNHRRKSLDALRDEVWLSRQNDPKVASRLIENLSSCENRLNNYSLNSLAYARHSANFRRSNIDDAFRALAVDELCSRAASTEPFRDYLDASPRAVGILDSSLGAIDDLAERRNEIAHGSPSQLLNLNELTEYLDFFDIFARSAYLVLCRFLGQFVVGHHAKYLGAVQKVHFHHVMCIDTGILPEGTHIEAGDLVAMRLSDNAGFEIGSIVNLRLDSGDVHEFRTQQDLKVGIETSFRLRESRDVYLIFRDNAVATTIARPLA